ncbi:hypothetical protein [Dolichospermum phage Dfl-JY45]
MSYSVPIALTSALTPAPSEALPEATSVAVREIAQSAIAANTRRSYTSGLAYWLAWHAARFGGELTLPVPEAVVIQFLVDHFGRPDNANAQRRITWELPDAVDRQLVAQGAKKRLGPLKYTTVLHRLTVLSMAHVRATQPSPLNTAQIQQLLRDTRRAAHAAGETPRKKLALTADEIRAMMDACEDDLMGLRDRALLAFGFASGGRRRSEIAEAVVENLRRTGPVSYVYALTHSKTRRTSAGSANAKPIIGDAAVALRAWLEASGATEGPLFRRVRGRTLGGALSGHAVGAIIQRRANAAGIDGDIAGHSVRSGFATEAGRRGIPLAEAMTLTDHKSAQTFLGYYQAGAVESNQAARVLDRPGPSRVPSDTTDDA